MKMKAQNEEESLQPEYDFDYSKSTRGKYSQRLMKEGSNVVMLEPDVAKAFSNATAVNAALRSLLEITRSTQRLTGEANTR